MSRGAAGVGLPGVEEGRLRVRGAEGCVFWVTRGSGTA